MPTLIFAAPKLLFDTETKALGKYWLVFGDSDGKELEFFGKERIERMVAIYFLWHNIDEKIKSKLKEFKLKGDEGPHYRALIAKWHFLWAYGFILKKVSF